jgi:hypothetical protein
MNVIDNIGDLLHDAEPFYAPLGLAPYEILGRGHDTEHSISQRFIENVVDTRTDLPEHVRYFAKIALSSELTKQANRNLIVDPSSVPDRARHGLMAPDELVELMMTNEDLRAVEIGRLTHFGTANVEQQIHHPIERQLFTNPRIDTKRILSRREFNQEFTSDEVIAVGIEQKRMSHLQGAIITSCRQLFLLDMEHSGNPLHDEETTLRGALARYIDGVHEPPEWLIPAVTTYYAHHPGRLEELKRADGNRRQSQMHYDVSPNLPIGKYWLA